MHPQLSCEPSSGAPRRTLKFASDVEHLLLSQLGLAVLLASLVSPIPQLVSRVLFWGAMAQVFRLIVSLPRSAVQNLKTWRPWAKKGCGNKTVNGDLPASAVFVEVNRQIPLGVQVLAQKLFMDRPDASPFCSALPSQALDSAMIRDFVEPFIARSGLP